MKPISAPTKAVAKLLQNSDEYGRAVTTWFNSLSYDHMYDEQCFDVQNFENKAYPMALNYVLNPTLDNAKSLLNCTIRPSARDAPSRSKRSIACSKGRPLIRRANPTPLKMRGGALSQQTEFELIKTIDFLHDVHYFSPFLSRPLSHLTRQQSAQIATTIGQPYFTRMAVSMLESALQVPLPSPQTLPSIHHTNDVYIALDLNASMWQTWSNQRQTLSVVLDGLYELQPNIPFASCVRTLLATAFFQCLCCTETGSTPFHEYTSTVAQSQKSINVSVLAGSSQGNVFGFISELTVLGGMFQDWDGMTPALQAFVQKLHQNLQAVNPNVRIQFLTIAPAPPPYTLHLTSHIDVRSTHVMVHGQRVSLLSKKVRQFTNWWQKNQTKGLSNVCSHVHQHFAFPISKRHMRTLAMSMDPTYVQQKNPSLCERQMNILKDLNFLRDSLKVEIALHQNAWFFTGDRMAYFYAKWLQKHHPQTRDRVCVLAIVPEEPSKPITWCM